jgi:hypothetical protein
MLHCRDKHLAGYYADRAYQGCRRPSVMLTLTFLGVGSAFAKRNYNSNCLFEYWEKPGTRSRQTPDDTLLIDLA